MRYIIDVSHIEEGISFSKFSDFLDEELKTIYNEKDEEYETLHEEVVKYLVMKYKKQKDYEVRN